MCHSTTFPHGPPANAYFIDVEGVVIDSGIEVQYVIGELVQGEVRGNGLWRVGGYQLGIFWPVKALFLVCT